ncbi:MAG: FeoB-associated Cys-rich membrane protein [Erysipelotrichaceae bacterium]|nr:FeoB-associated Cys-rich membrane protein [Erysipelotrichaceae bacterium]
MSDVIVVIIISVLCILALIGLFRGKKKGKGRCGGNCASCSNSLCKLDLKAMYDADKK